MRQLDSRLRSLWRRPPHYHPNACIGISASYDRVTGAPCAWLVAERVRILYRRECDNAPQVPPALGVAICQPLTRSTMHGHVVVIRAHYILPYYGTLIP